MPTITTQLVSGSGVTREPDGIRIPGLAWVFFGGAVDTLTSGACTYYGLDNSESEVFRMACYEDMNLEPILEDTETYCYGERVADQVLHGFSAGLTVTEDMADLRYLQKWMRQAAARFCENTNENVQTLLVDDGCLTAEVPVLFEHHYTECCDGGEDDQYVGWLFFRAKLSLGALTFDPVEGLSAPLEIEVEFDQAHGAYYSLMRHDPCMEITELEFKTVCGPLDSFDPTIGLVVGCPYTPQWDWGDGTAWGSGANPGAHTYANSNEHTVKLHMPHLETWLAWILITNDKITYVDPQWCECQAITAFVAQSNATWTQDISDWVLPNSLTTGFSIDESSVVGDITNWVLPPNIATFGVWLCSGLTGDVSGWVLPDGLQYLYLQQTALTGDVSGWVLPDSLVNLNLYLIPALTGDISGWVLPAGLSHLSIYNTLLSGDVSGWVLPVNLEKLNLNNTLLTGDVSGWVIPSAWLLELDVGYTALTGDVSGWVLPAKLIFARLRNTSLSGAPVFSSAVVLNEFRYSNCALPQVTVDLICSRIYARRMAFTAAAPKAYIGGTNSTPSGVYAHEGPPPVTGKGFIFTLQNDENLEGFKKWVFSYSP